jgi:3-dehydroquinate synthase
MAVDPRNLVLTGFMGTGKSSVGRAVAQELRRPFVDIDTLIIERAGMSIPRLFRQHGEARFRELEAEVCRELSAQQGLVVATGGGALVDATNRELVLGSCCVICLDCQPDRLVARIGHDDNRPMLWGEDTGQRLAQLLHERQPAYAEIPLHIDTTARTLDETIVHVLRLFQAAPTVARVRTPNGRYPILQVPGGLEDLGALLRTRNIVGQVVVVSDDNVWTRYGPEVLHGLGISGYAAGSLVVTAGEQHKNLDTVRQLYDGFVTAGLDRSGAVVALGGGVITDMAGFAASTFMRGVPLVQVPTTLLGMVDASVGGKVAVDHPQGKNLIGAFVTPLLVLIDAQTLDTLPEIEHRSGLAEIIKAGIIADPELFAALEPGQPPQKLHALVSRALQVKIHVVEEDPFEHGRRAVLNLGHTFAHALEVLANYGLHHGLAVSVGMVAAAYLAEDRGLCTAETRKRIIDTLRHHGLPISHSGFAPSEVYAAMSTDKKRRGASLRFVLPQEIGQVVVERDIPPEQVLAALERICS